MSSDIGGFFVKLGLNTDKNSFEQGFKSVDQMTNGINRLVGTIRNAAPIIMAGLAGSFETAELKTARAIGVSTQVLDKWKTAASIAGTNANGLTQGMAQLEAKMNAMKIGQIDQGLAQSLGFMGINYTDFADMNAEQRLSTVIKTAQAMEDQKKAALLVGNILGSAGQDYYYYLQTSGKSLENQLAIGQSLVFTSEKSKRDAMEFNSELQGVVAAGKSMSMLFGSEVGKQLTPLVRNIRQWIGANNELISQGIVEFVDDVGIVFNKLVGGVEKAAPLVKAVIDGFGGLDQVIIKVGIGIAALQAGKLAMNLMSIFSSVSLVKMALMGLAGGALAGGLIDIIKNPDSLANIKKQISGLADAFGNIVKALTGKANVGEAIDSIINGVTKLAGAGIETTIKLITDLGNALASLLQGDWSKVGSQLKQFFIDFKNGVDKVTYNGATGTIESFKDTFGFNGKEAQSLAKQASVVTAHIGQDYQKNHNNKLPTRFSKADWSDLSEATRQEYLQYIQLGGSPDKIANLNVKSINDGIISPNGSVTQVAPNDWVFAAKNIGDLAGAFFPQAAGNSTTSYVINQTFNVSGSRDIPSTIRQQAYSGTQSALMQSMSESSRRLQMMPGAR